MVRLSWLSGEIIMFNAKEAKENKMCAIFGIAIFKNSSFTDNKILEGLITNLMRESELSGRDATGLAFVLKSRIAVIKKNVEAERFSRMLKVKKAIKEYADLKKVDGPEKLHFILGHTRAQTKGTHRVKENNHPIITPKIVGVHNGIIQNDDQLFNRYNTVPYIKRRGEVDSEIIFQLIDHYANNKGIGTKYAIIDTVNRLNGGYACALANRADSDCLWLFRGFNATTILMYPKAGILIFSTARSYITSAINKLGHHAANALGPAKEIEYPHDTGMGINVVTMKAHRFNLHSRINAHVD